MPMQSPYAAEDQRLAGLLFQKPFVGPPMPPGQQQQPGYGSFGQGQMAGPPATQRPVVPAPPREPPAPQRDFGADYEDLLRKIREGTDSLARDQRAVGDQYRDRAKPLMQGDLQYDLSPLAALVDSWTGSGLQKGYQRPETGDERQARIAKLQDGASSAGLQARGTELDALKDLASGTMGLEKLRSDEDYKKQTLAIQREQNAIARDKVKAFSGSAGLLGGKPTEAQKVVDRKFGARYEEDVVGGNLAVAQRDRQGLVNLRDSIRRGELGEISGPSIGGTPEFARGFIHPKAVGAQQQIEKAVQSSLKSTLGSQFTEREGANILARTFDPKLPQEENMRRLDVLIAGLEAVDQAKQGAYSYYEQNGTLRGYKGADNLEGDFMASIADQPPELDDEDRAYLDWARKNPSDPMAQQILKLHGAK